MVQVLMDTRASLIAWRAPSAHWRLDPEPLNVKVTQTNELAFNFLFGGTHIYFGTIAQYT
jgi:hypothetical protein